MTQFLRAAYRSTRWKLWSLLLLWLLADRLFNSCHTAYCTQYTLPYSLLGLALLGAALLHNAYTLNRQEAFLAGLLLTGLVIAYIIAPSPLAILLFLGGLAVLTLRSTGYAHPFLREWLKSTLLLPLLLAPTFSRSFHKFRKIVFTRKRAESYRRLRHWVLPIGMTLLFLCSLGSANPILARWLDKALHVLPDLHITKSRLYLWLAILILGWACIRPRIEHFWHSRIHQPGAKEGALINWLFTKESILRALIMFNLLFVVNLFSDTLFLWEDGSNYAWKAQDAAYALLVTALLAAAFTLIALREGSEAAQSRVICNLVLLWVGQNILLVGSALYRLSIYVAAYSLTYWRVAAFIWMGLVAAGLALIILRILCDKSSLWLVRANAIALFSVLYLCTLLPIGSYIAQYNVTHSKEMGGEGASLDVYYLSDKIGKASLPALQRYIAQGNLTLKQRYIAVLRFQGLLKQSARYKQNWRYWNLQDYWLHRNMDENAVAFSARGQ